MYKEVTWLGVLVGRAVGLTHKATRNFVCEYFRKFEREIVRKV
jgi:hypothetical protein